jgi:putative ABC transport system permease protein
LPANISFTRNHETTLQYTGYSKADAYASYPDTLSDILQQAQNQDEDYTPDRVYTQIKSTLRHIEREFAEAGIGIEADVTLLVSLNIYKDNELQQFRVTGEKYLQDKPADFAYYAGSAPILINEIAVSKRVADRLGIALGDKITLVCKGDGYQPEEEKSYYVAGQIHSQNECIIFSSNDHSFFEYTGFSAMRIHFTDRENIPRQIKSAQEKLPNYNIMTPVDYLHSVTFGQNALTLVLLSYLLASMMIVCLVTFLISRTLLAKDKSNIALLKSIGFTNSSIRLWQIFRFALVSAAAILAGIGLSFPIYSLLSRMYVLWWPEILIHYDFLGTFIFYPLILFLSVTGISMIAFLGIRKISMRNLGNLE